MSIVIGVDVSVSFRFVYSQIICEELFLLFACDSSVSLLILAQEALFCREDCAAAIYIYAAAFQYNSTALPINNGLRFPSRHSKLLSYKRRQLLISLVIRILGPAVESPMSDRDLRVLLARNKDR